MPSNNSDKSESVDLLISLIYEFMLLISFKKKGTWYFWLDLHEFNKFILYWLYKVWIFYYLFSKSSLLRWILSLIDVLLNN